MDYGDDGHLTFGCGAWSTLALEIVSLGHADVCAIREKRAPRFLSAMAPSA